MVLKGFYSVFSPQNRDLKDLKVSNVALNFSPNRRGFVATKWPGVEKEYPHLALARLSGLRPWRVVAAPALRGRGFGQKALEQLELHVRRGTFKSCVWIVCVKCVLFIS